MKAEIVFCKNTSGLIEHIRIELNAETLEDKGDLDLLCQTGVVCAYNDSEFSYPGEKVSSATIYLPAKKEVVVP